MFKELIRFAEYKKQCIDYMPYYQYDTVVIIPNNWLDIIKYLFKPINYIYIYVGHYKLVTHTFDEDIRIYGENRTSIVDSRDRKFADSLIRVYRSANRMNRIQSPETEIVMFLHRKLHKKVPDLKFNGIL